MTGLELMRDFDYVRPLVGYDDVGQWCRLRDVLDFGALDDGGARRPKIASDRCGELFYLPHRRVAPLCWCELIAARER